MHFKQQCLNQNNEHIVHWVLLFLGCLVTPEPSACHVCSGRACAQIFWEDLGEETVLQQWEGRREAISAPSLCAVLQWFKSQQLSLHLLRVS